MGRKLFGNEENQRSWWQSRERGNKYRQRKKQIETKKDTSRDKERETSRDKERERERFLDCELLTRISLRTITDIEIGWWSRDTCCIIFTRIPGTGIILFGTGWTTVTTFTVTGEIIDT